MRTAKPEELKDQAVPVLSAAVPAERLRELFPVRFKKVHSYAAPEPSKGALVQLQTGSYVVVIYGLLSQELSVLFPKSADFKRQIKEFFSEVPLKKSAISWLRPGLEFPSPQSYRRVDLPHSVSARGYSSGARSASSVPTARNSRLAYAKKK